jgi:DNA-3-methyladenine glycosylase II
MDITLLQPMTDAEVIAYLTQIKGVGVWTAEMLLMFSLGREDVFSAGDLGIQQAMIRLYKLSPDDKRKLKERMLSISEKWSPYRTYACLHLWHQKDWPVATKVKKK